MLGRAYSALQTGAGWSGKNAQSDAALETTKQARPPALRGRPNRGWGMRRLLGRPVWAPPKAI
ncbi:hypothetical protein T484DRAFT_1791316 [Baffinella frigidus]|nr:hypothetical protein T484DRAFT_1791316 [Cryptophyta sp. CCMP2293]